MPARTPCGARLDAAKTAIKWAIAMFITATPLVAAAIITNAGFFSAPFSVGLMLGAALACASAAAKLLEAAQLLAGFKTCGGLARDCFDEAAYAEDMIRRAMATVTAAATLCFAVAAFAWIPWVAGVAMIGVLVFLGATALGLKSLVDIWEPLDQCQKRVATSRGALEYGELPGDPWFLRLRPLDGLPYARAVDDGKVEIKKDVVNHTFIRLSLMGAKQWEIRAAAEIVGPSEVEVSFSWTLDGRDLGPGSAAPDKRHSTLIHTTPSVDTEEALLRVVATDKSGYTREKKVIVYVPTEHLEGRTWVALLQPEFRSPALPVTQERLRRAFDAFQIEAAEIAQAERAMTKK